MLMLYVSMLDREDDRRDFEMIYHRYHDDIFRRVYRILQNTEEAKDAVQETFLRYLTKAPEFESEEHRKAWLIRVTVNSVKTMKRSAWLSRRDDTPVQTIADSGNDKDAVIAVREAVMRLDKKYRIIVILYYYYGYTCNEIAEMTDIKAATVKTRLSRARDILKKHNIDSQYKMEHDDSGLVNNYIVTLMYKTIDYEYNGAIIEMTSYCVLRFDTDNDVLEWNLLI